MRSRMIIFYFLLLLLSSNLFATGKAIVLKINNPIVPAMYDYLHTGLNYAISKEAKVIILQIDTVGGLESTTRRLNQAIIHSPIPVIGFVSPEGAHAASAGTFILYASQLSAMAPGTNIGASTPINLLGINQENLSVSQKKAINDASAYLRSLAQMRGRNVDWAKLTVEQANGLSAEEALSLNVIDLIAKDNQDLLQKADGHKVIIQNVATKLDTKNLEIEMIEPGWRYEFLTFLTNPNITYLLILIAIYALFFELSNPGAILPGVIGLMCLLLSLYAFQLMPVNYTGLTMILVGLSCFVFEIYLSSFGVVGILGLIAFIIGSIMLFNVNDYNFQINWTLIFLMSAISVTFFLMILGLAISSHKKAIVTGKEGLIGSEGVILSVINKQIVVRIKGEIWDATTTATCQPGQKVRVKEVNDLTLLIEPIPEKKNESLGE